MMKAIPTKSLIAELLLQLQKLFLGIYLKKKIDLLFQLVENDERHVTDKGIIFWI